MNSGILKIGDNVDIRILQQVEQGWKTGDRPDSYASKIQNILDNGDIIADIPIFNMRYAPIHALLGVK